MRGWFETLGRDLESPIAVRRFGSGWFAGSSRCCSQSPVCARSHRCAGPAGSRCPSSPHYMLGRVLSV
jgi:hypothetical protein